MTIIQNLTQLNISQLDAATKCVTAAFADDPSVKYMIPDPEKRANLKYINRYFIKLCMLGGGKVMATSPGCEGVAIWLPSNAKSFWWHKIRAGLLLLPFRLGWHYIFYSYREEQFGERLKKKYAPRQYMYLALLAVDPKHQGKGYASKLIRPMLKELDEAGLPCYAETQNKRNVAMYKRYGFTLLESTFFPPGSECEVHIILRKATG